MHTLVVIGWLGSRTAYLDVPQDEALRRYLAENSYEKDIEALTAAITEFQFEDEFYVYDADSAR